MHPVLRLVRSGNVIVSFLGTVVGAVVARGAGFAPGVALWEVALLAAGSTACVTAGGNVLNDLRDVASDRTNHPDRPLVTGEVAHQSARGLVAGLLVVSLLLVLPLIPHAPLVAVIWAGAVSALLLYEFRFKAEGLAGNLLVAVLTSGVFLYGAAAAGNASLLVPFALMAFFATLSREVIKDMEDAEGDVDRRTLPRTHGLRVASGVARGSVAVALAFSPLPLLTFLGWGSPVGIIYLALVGAADAVFVVSVLWLPRELHREQTLSKGAMTVALLAFLVAAFR
ncbi:MAG: geranylgeranylglycerol-phosphate geranylgeranyltransferase [Thermoplasmata archaeon]|nr:geranylgeranylglycerol-phosphate geranylgeranyltransferase [Thermoplasmata archaeon]